MTVTTGVINKYYWYEYSVRQDGREPWHTATAREEMVLMLTDSNYWYCVRVRSTTCINYSVC